ncbi:MAG: hypothetical protein RIR60_47 [Pseudomonadota bacterium]|jgi:hypothetical protein
MLKRYAVHFALVVLFALTQIGLSTHEIKHVNELSQHSQQQHKKAANEPCAQCLSYAQVAHGLSSASYSLAAISAGFAQHSNQPFQPSSALVRAYAARAPPQTISL